MKKLMTLFVILLVSMSSCISTKSTIKNIDQTAVRPFVKNKMFLLTEYAKDSKYGTDTDYPINIGIINANLEPVFIAYFFNGIEGPKGEKIVFKKIDSCCPFPSKNSNMGAGLLAVYEANFEGSNKKQIYYFNIYEKGTIACPKGFLIKKTS
tara:strand:+ start:1204 stop:1659 length:456 start_codon:yes stop_codon:yes gene_type:complete